MPTLIDNLALTGGGSTRGHTSKSIPLTRTAYGLDKVEVKHYHVSISVEELASIYVEHRYQSHSYIGFV